MALSWCSATNNLQEGTTAPGQVLWFCRWCPQVSSWALAPSHRLIMRLNWRFSLIFPSFDVLNPIRRAYLIRASCTWHSDPYGCYLAWTPPGLILPQSKHFSLSLIPQGLKYYSRLAGVIPQQSTGMWGHGIAPGHENQCLLSGRTATDGLENQRNPISVMLNVRYWSVLWFGPVLIPPQRKSTLFSFTQPGYRGPLG